MDERYLDQARWAAGLYGLEDDVRFERMQVYDLSRRADEFDLMVDAGMVWQEDEPLAHPSSIALYFVARLAAEDVKVVLTGEGSDELLGGYGRYWKTLTNLRLGSLYDRMTITPVRDARAAAPPDPAATLTTDVYVSYGA